MDSALGGERDGSEMGALIRAKDWSSTPLGPMESWSPALRTMTSILLANRFPMLLWWGPDSISIYNDAYIPVLGVKHPNALGQPVRECWSEIWDVLEPMVRTPLMGGPPTWSDDLRLHLRRYGFLEETHWTIAYSPVPDETAPNGIGGVLATVHEITAQVVGRRRSTLLHDLGVAGAKTAEEACTSAAAVFARYPDDVPFASIYLLDGEATQLVASTGSAPACDWPIADVVRCKRAQLVEEAHALVMPIETGPQRLAGVLVIGLSPLLELDDAYRVFAELAASRLASAIAAARAFDEERRRAEALAEVDRTKTAFFSNVSHEFRTPLTLLLGPVEESLQDAREPLSDAHRQRLEAAHRNGLRLLKLVSSLLDFSRIEAGRAVASYEPTEIGVFTSEIASAFETLVDRAGLSLVIDCPRDAEPVFVDRPMWEKIVLNLVSNAFKYTFAGGITVRVEMSPEVVRLVVGDTGVGIAAEHVPHIFDRFYRVEDARGRTHEGSGIGLALVRELARLHGGSVSVESEVGKGTTFTVTIPRGSAHLPQDRTSPATPTSTQNYVEEAAGWLGDAEVTPLDEHADTHILVADDNADMRTYVARLLRPLGSVETVKDGREALAAIARRMPDLVISDVMMPNLDGIGLVRALRDDARTRTLPILLLSARAGEDSRVEGDGLGADGYIVKPFVAHELVARVRTQLQLARQRREHAQALAESEERFRALVTATADVVYRMNADWSEMRQLVGRDFIADTTDPNRNWLEKYIYPDDQARVIDVIADAIRDKRVFELEHRVRQVDGSVGWTFSRAIPLFDSRGEIVEWFGAASDITKRKRIEEALRTSEERYRTLFESIDEGFCVFDMIFDDAGRPVDYRFVEVNPAFESHTGLANARGKRIRDLVPEHEAMWFDIYGAVAMTGEPRRFEGRGEGMHRWFDVYAFRLGAAEDRRVAAVFTDITERKLAEEALRISEKRFAAFFERGAIAMSIVRLDDQRYVEVNDKWIELFGYSRYEAIGMTSLELDPEQVESVHARIRADGFVRDVELTLRKRSGEQCIGLLSAQVVEVAGDRVIVSSFLDITDRKAAEHALVEADRRKDEFLGMLSHELRNPLAPISNGLFILDHAEPGSEQAIRAKQVVDRQVTQLSNLVNDLLDVTRIVSGKVQLQKEHLDLAEIVRRTVEDNRSLFERAGVALEVNVPSNRVPVFADPTRAAQVVGNLLQNAAKFASSGGNTRVSVAVEGRDAVIRVADDGVGMSRETLSRLFEPFTQAEQTLDRSKGGLGLGLTLVKGLAELHGGTASAHSAGIGQGTEMVVRFPLDRIAGADAVIDAPSAAAVRRRVLIIEDNTDAADTLGEILALRDNDVAIAYDGAAGLAKARTLHPDVVLCDLGLPGMDGYDVARKVREDAELADTFLVALTGYARPEDMRRAADAGFDRHLAKPVSLDQLSQLLAELPQKN
jgi:PAS domain S-box-containing protein